MNYSEAISFIFRDKEWLKKITLGGFCLFIALFTGILFFVGFFAIGYYVSVMRNVMQGQENTLPEWKDWNKLFVDGLMGAIILFINFLVIGSICAIIIVGLALTEDLADYERVLGIVFTSIGTILALTITINLGLMRFAATNDFVAAFRVAEISQLLKKDFGNYLGIIIFTAILNAFLFLAGLGIFSPFTVFWGWIVQAHLFGQYAKAANTQAALVQTA